MRGALKPGSPAAEPNQEVVDRLICSEETRVVGGTFFRGCQPDRLSGR
jgi:hypothetical protein